MAEVGMRTGAVKLKILADPDKIDRVASLLVDALETAGIVVIEWSRPYPGDERDQWRQRVYVVALMPDGEPTKGEQDGLDEGNGNGTAE